MSQIDRFKQCAVLSLNTEGFEKLSFEKKQLVYHLSEAGLYGRNIFLQQNYIHNLTLKNFLEDLYKSIQKDDNLNQETFLKFEEYLKTFWFHVGIYDSFSNKRLTVLFNESELEYLIQSSNININNHDIELIKNILFNDSFTQLYKNIQKEGHDVVKDSGGNFYENLTSLEVDMYRKVSYPNVEDSPQFGFNVRLVKKVIEENISEEHPLYKNSLKYIATEYLKNTSENNEVLIKKIKSIINNKNNQIIEEEIISENGLYGKYVSKIVEHLEQALNYTENEQQYEAIKTLTDFYRTGDAKDFDVHSLNWVKDQESEIFFINGLIESYDDPKGVGCTFESIVAFKNPEQTKKVNQIIENIQWFEDNMPVDKRFKKEKASGLSASSVTVASMAGATSPSLPLGICLPNSDWIREKHGSKSVNLLNVHNARGDSELDLKKEFLLPEYIEVVSKYGSLSGSLHTDLHEVAGHGSCRSLEGVSNEDLDIYYAVIEEARADLVGLYFLPCKELKEFGIIDNDVDLEDFTMAQYVNYLTNGVILNLRRVELGADLAQPHMRNRQLISTWIIEKAINSKSVELIIENNKHFIKVNDLNKCRELFGQLLQEIQKIKSEGDYTAAKCIVEQYGTKVNKKIHQEVLDRVSKLDIPLMYGFTTPILTPIKDEQENIIDYISYQKETFIEDQLFLSDKYNL